MFDYAGFTEHAEAICSIGTFLFRNGWCPATSSNFSSRLDAEYAAITASGVHKGELTPQDILCVDLNGQPVNSQRKPSAETLLHTHLYQRDASIGAVLHTHSVNATVLSRLYADKAQLQLEDYEVLKALAGINTHASQAIVPIFPNSQDMTVLAKQVDTWLTDNPETYGYCIAGHGLYTWGKDLTEARRHIEAFEYLFECEVLTLRLAAAIA